MAAEVRTPVFEGPFDLLLHLILRSEVDVYEVSLSDVVAGYLTELERMETFELEAASEFLLIAATLIELKSRSLLPDEETGEEEEDDDLWASRDRLLARLLECQTYRNAAEVFEEMRLAAARSHPRRAGPEASLVEVFPNPLAGVAPEDLLEAFLRAVEVASAPEVDLSFIASVTSQVPDVISDLRERLPSLGQIGFAQLTSSLKSRMEVVTHFLALLEMYRQSMVSIHQAKTFGEIIVEWSDVQSPGDADFVEDLRL